MSGRRLRDRDQDIAERNASVLGRDEGAAVRGNEERHLARFSCDRFGDGFAQPIETMVMRRDDDEIGSVLAADK